MFIQELKTFSKKKWLFISIFIIFLLLPFFSFNQGIVENKILKNLIPKNKIVQGLPTRLIIPIINIDAKIQYLGITQSGEIEVPNNSIDVGWFKLGPWPGEKGSSVIAGHFNGINNEAGVFFNLYKLKKNDKLFIKNNKGETIVFVVREKRLYDPGYADDVFNSSDSAHLNLITCDGLWDGIKKTYTKRLVIFTDKSPLDNNYK